jgi:hypothetical protein
MTDKSMFDILSKFDNAGKTPVNESAPQVRRSSSAGDPAMFDILAKLNSVQEAGPANYPAYKGGDSNFDQTTNDPNVMATPSIGGYQATKNMKTGDTTQTYDNGSMRTSVSHDAQGNQTRSSASYKMNDVSNNIAQAGDEKWSEVDTAATGAGDGEWGAMHMKGNDLANSTIGVVGQTGTMDQTTTGVDSEFSGNKNTYQSDRDTSNMIKQQEKDIARLSTDKLFNDVNEDENDMPASDEEASMAGDQAEYIKYAIDEIKDSIEAGNSFPEWFQNKLSGVYTTLKDLHAYMEGDKRNDADEMMFDDAPDMSDRMQQLRGMRNRDAEANFTKTHANHGIDGAAMSSRMHSDALAHAGEFADPRKLARGAMNMGMSPERVDRALPADFKFDEDVVSKDKAKGADVVGEKHAADDVVKELAKSYADFIAQVEEEKDDMSFFKKGK